MTFTIDKDVPLPPEVGGRGKGYATAVRALDVGDSVWFPCTVDSVANTAHRILGAGNYAVRASYYAGNPGTRVWRRA